MSLPRGTLPILQTHEVIRVGLCEGKPLCCSHSTRAIRWEWPWTVNSLSNPGGVEAASLCTILRSASSEVPRAKSAAGPCSEERR